MLDISIVALDKVVKNSKQALEFLKKHVVAVEKIDGTKLTLIRNDADFDPSDYTKNWIVSYKGSIIYPTEFEGLQGKDEEIRKKSIGISQYKFVHDHLRNVHPSTGSIPKNTEFFVEFVQNKPTLTRDYLNKHGLFLVGFGPTQFAISRGHVYSSSKFLDDKRQLDKYRKILELNSFPVVFDGNLATADSILSGCLDESLRASFQSVIEKIDFSDPVSIVNGVRTAFSQFESSLGGPAEGVVLEVGDDQLSQKQLMKVLATDQHDKSVRWAKKSRFMGPEEEEKQYWKDVNIVADDLISNLKAGTPEQMLKNLTSIVYSSQDLPTHPKKSGLRVQEDILDTAKLRLFSTGSIRAKKIGVIPMAAKPFHMGHDSLLRRAVSDKNEFVIVLVSKGGRESIKTEDMIPLWRDYFIPGIQQEYGDEVIVKFVDSPARDAMFLCKDMIENGQATVRYYGDEVDAQARVNDILEKYPNLKGRLLPVGVPRSETEDVSGTAMRDYLERKDEKSFTQNLPSWLTSKQKAGVWRDMLKISGRKIQRENLIKEYVKSVLKT